LKGVEELKKNKQAVSVSLQNGGIAGLRNSLESCGSGTGSGGKCDIGPEKYLMSKSLQVLIVTIFVDFVH